MTIVVAPDAAHAQTARGFALNRFEPSERGSEWFANDTLDLRGRFRPAFGVIGDYGHKPYVLLNPDGSENTSIVRDQFYLHVGASVVLFHRLRLGTTLPLALGQSGNETGGVVNGQRIVAEGGGGVGDLRLGADLRLAGHYGGPATLALGGRIWFPTGNATRFLGDDAVRVGPQLALAGDLGPIAYAANVGVVYRANDQAFAGHPTGTQATFGMALGVRALEKKLLIGPEVWGSTNVTTSDAVFSNRTTPLALLGSVHYTYHSLRLGGGAGPGLSDAAGTAAFRALASVEYVPPVEPDARPACPDADHDGDGISDSQDACPAVRGVRTTDPATNGCPPDRDRDQVLDSEDACVDVPGVRTSDPKTNGCPADRDGDGVIDAEDACPAVAGLRTADPKTNGCPDPDRDKDGVLNDQDACPDVAGPKSHDPTTHGCPRVFIQNAQIRILEQPKFDFNKSHIKKESDSLLGEVAKAMSDHPELVRIRVEGHSDGVGGAEYNRKLSLRRAQAVVAWLASHGIDKLRLTAEGVGKDRPLASNDTEAGRAVNRRVEFHIEQQSSQNGAARE